MYIRHANGNMYIRYERVTYYVVETGKCRANVRKWTINNETKESEKRLFNIYILRSILVQFIFGDQRLVGKDDVLCYKYVMIGQSKRRTFIRPQTLY
jgi:hypothetical protein